tara:strand:- start:1395 stop:1715 length:321 start_codon:yes stop_codon:yes gene_type:complete
MERENHLATFRRQKILKELKGSSSVPTLYTLSPLPDDSNWTSRTVFLLFPAIGKRVSELEVPAEYKEQQAELVEWAKSGRALIPSDIQSSGEDFLLWIMEKEEDCY